LIGTGNENKERLFMRANITREFVLAIFDKPTIDFSPEQMAEIKERVISEMDNGVLFMLKDQLEKAGMT
jgi:hypothetical protein